MTLNPTIRVGFVGLNARNTLAIKTHFQAIMQVSSLFEISAVYNEDINDSIDIIKKLALQSATAYPSIRSFIQSSNIDMVVITSTGELVYNNIVSIIDSVRESSYRIKYMFFEWSLNCTLNQTEQIVKETMDLGIQTIISLQSRKSPYIIRAKELIDEGSIGIINSIEITGNGNWFGYQRIQKSPQYLYDINARKDLVSYCFGHTIDALQYMAGSYFSTINSMIFNNIPEQELVDDFGNSLGQKVAKEVSDHLLFQGKLIKGNVPVSCSIKGGKPTKKFTKNLVIDIHGTKGDLKIEGDAGFIEISNLVLYHSGVKVNFDQETLEQQNDAQVLFDANNEVMEFFHFRNYNALVGNMAKLYQSIADFHSNTAQNYIYDMTLGNDSLASNENNKLLMQGFQFDGFPTLIDAVILYRLVESVYKSNTLGTTLNVSNICQYP